MRKELTKQEKNLLRERFIVKFCKERNWNYNELTTGQMLIITKQTGFINPQF
jgi:hypothetical protein